MARPMIPGTRRFRETMRALAVEDANTSDPVGLYAPNDRPARRTLAPLGGRTATLMGSRAFRLAFANAWFLATGTWNDAGLWRDGVAWQ